MKLKDLIEKYGEQEVLCWAARADESLEWVNIKLEPPKPKTVWDLEKGDKYFVACYRNSTYTYDMRTWGNGNYEKAGRETGILFLTKEEAEKDVERKKVETLLLKYGGRRWFNENSENFYIYYDMDIDVVDCTNTYDFHCQGPIYFDSEIQAEKAISDIGEERIKKALFEVR